MELEVEDPFRVVGVTPLARVDVEACAAEDDVEEALLAELVPVLNNLPNSINNLWNGEQ